MTFDEALAQFDLRADEDNRSDVLTIVDDTGFDFDRFIPEDRVDRACQHPVVYPDTFDRVFRCVECDEPVEIPGVAVPA